MIQSEIIRIAGRRGLFVTSLALGIVASTALAVSAFLRGDPQGGTDLLDALMATSLVPTFGCVLIGALAGSYDASQGTLRYLVMTGVPRGRLFVSRIVGTAIAIVLVCLPALAIGLAAALVIEHPATADPRAGDLAGSVWGYVSQPLIYGLIAVAVGSLLRSNGAAVGVCLGLLLGATAVSAVVAAELGDGVAGYLLPNAATAVGSLEGGSVPLAGAGAALVAWLAVFVLPSALRFVRSEY